MNNTNIRRAAVSDVALLHSIGKKTFEDTFGGTCTKEDMKGVLELYFNEKQCESELNDKDDNFFFWEENGITKGYMRINDKHDYPLNEWKDLKCIELVRLYVLKEYHGTSVATDLMQYAFEYARQKGFQKIYLSVWEYNFRARGFYQKMGFVNTEIENDFPLGSTPQTDYWFVKDL